MKLVSKRNDLPPCTKVGVDYFDTLESCAWHAEEPPWKFPTIWILTQGKNSITNYYFGCTVGEDNSLTSDLMEPTLLDRKGS